MPTSGGMPSVMMGSCVSTVDPPPSRIIITGLGLISPLGLSAWETWAALLAGRTIADRAGRLPPDVDLVARVRATGCVAAAQHVAVDPAVELAERAAREAIAEARVSPDGLPCFIGTSKGAVTSWSHVVAGHCRTPQDRAARAVALGPCGFLTHELRRRMGLGQVQHYVAACASSLHALHAARQHLSSGMSRCLVLTTESALLPAFIHSYRRLGVLAPVHDYAARPLDRRRRGFMLAEIGAAVVLHRVERVLAGQIELVDTAVAAEAHDLIRPSAAMPALRRVAKQLARHGPIDVLHPHAPGTPDHDAAELDALLVACDSRHATWPRVYASKGALGHTLGAAGLVSLVLACLAARAHRLPPMPWLEQPLDHPLVTCANAHAISRVAVHAIFAAGFGGHVAAALIRR